MIKFVGFKFVCTCRLWQHCSAWGVHPIHQQNYKKDLQHEGMGSVNFAVTEN